jgi:hypothetical protein
MKGFHLLDSSGNLKVTPFPSGANLPDPVTVAHGGTGLTTVAQGDLLYGSASNVLSSLAKDAGGLRVLTNQGASNNPTWQDPSAGFPYIKQPTTEKWVMSEWFAGSSTPQSVGWTGTSDGTPTSVVDSTSAWVRYTSGAVAGNNAGFRITADWNRLDHLPTLKCVLRTGSSILNLRYWIVLTNQTAALSNSDNQAAIKGVGIRYSTGVPDGGFVPWTSDGSSQSIGSTIASIAASTSYAITIQVTSTSSVTMTVGGSSQTVSIPAGALATNMRPGIQVTTTDANAKFFDLTSVYGEWS